MKTFKKILLSIAIIFAIVFANGCYYVFHGQFKSVEKLNRGEELNLYECCSIYTMHVAICSIGVIYSPEATMEILGMSFAGNRDKTITIKSDFFLKSPTIQKIYKSQWDTKRIAFKDSAYALYNPEHRVALAANPGFLHRDNTKVYFEVPVHYPACCNTRIGITKGISIVINECLLTYLEEKHILHPYTVIYESDI